MNWRNMMYGFILVALTLTLNACGGDDSASGGLPAAALTGVNTGIAVDPYIVNAQFEEVSADGKTLLQRSSSFTDVQGRFSFPQPITENSIIRLKASSKGMHGDAPYAGVLKRKVSIADDGTIVVSPLTTLVANGMTDAEVTRLMADAGLPGLDTAAIYTDPLENLMERSAGVNDAMLVNLQANMAANNFMEATGNFNYRGEATGLQMADMVASVEHSLNADLFNQLSAQIGADFTLGDLVNTAVQLNRTIVSQVREEVNGSGSLSTQRVEEITVAAVADIDQVAMEVTQNRTGLTIEPTPDPVPTPTPDPVVPVTGEDLYVTECQGCHGSLQTTNISNRTATGIQAAIAGNAGGMGSLLLSADEVQRIADALPVPSPPPVEPPQYRNGQAVYDQECAGCHILSTHDDVGNIDLAGLGSVLTGKIEAGHMGKTLPTQELSALADFADTFTPPAPPVVPRSSQTVYDENCAGCHKLNGYDAVGNIDLAGMGNTALTKIPTGHGGSLSTEELTNLAAWLDSWAPVPPPVVARDGQVVYDDNCAGCHKIYGYDANGNIDLASMGSTAATKLATGHG
ncbi:MAG: cytochrome c, partial [Desulfuromonadales bacterium]